MEYKKERDGEPDGTRNHTHATWFPEALWRPDVKQTVLGAASHAYRSLALPIGVRSLPRMQNGRQPAASRPSHFSSTSQLMGSRLPTCDRIGNDDNDGDQYKASNSVGKCCLCMTRVDAAPGEKVSLKLFYVLEHFSEIAENLLKLQWRIWIFQLTYWKITEIQPKFLWNLSEILSKMNFSTKIAEIKLKFCWNAEILLKSILKHGYNFSNIFPQRAYLQDLGALIRI